MNIFCADWYVLLELGAKLAQHNSLATASSRPTSNLGAKLAMAQFLSNCFQSTDIQSGCLWTSTSHNSGDTLSGIHSAAGTVCQRTCILFQDIASAAVFRIPGICTALNAIYIMDHHKEMQASQQVHNIFNFNRLRFENVNNCHVIT